MTWLRWALAVAAVCITIDRSIHRAVCRLYTHHQQAPTHVGAVSRQEH